MVVGVVWICVLSRGIVWCGELSYSRTSSTVGRDMGDSVWMGRQRALFWVVRGIKGVVGFHCVWREGIKDCGFSGGLVYKGDERRVLEMVGRDGERGGVVSEGVLRRRKRGLLRDIDLEICSQTRGCKIFRILIFRI